MFTCELGGRCGAELAATIAREGVLVLDATPIDMTQVEAQRATWCADAAGRLLP